MKINSEVNSPSNMKAESDTPSPLGADAKNSANSNCAESGGSKRIITVVACLTVQLCVGILYLWSVFNKPVQTYFSWSTDAALSPSLVSSFMIFGFVIGNLVGGYLQDRTNPRLIATIGCALFCAGVITTSFLTPGTVYLIFVTYSLVAGLGCGFTYACMLSCLQKWFPMRRGFASGLSAGAFALSTVIFAPVSKALLDNEKIGVPYTFLILGCVFLAVTMAACLFIRLPKTQKTLAAIDNNSLTPLQAMKKPAFWCIFFSSFFINATWNILVPIISPLGIERGLTPVIATLAVTLTGITNASGRLGMATASDKIGRTNTIILMSVLTMVCAVSLIWAQSWFYLVIVALTAFGYGGPAGTLPAMTVDTAGKKYSGTNYGIILLSLGFSSVIFGWFSTLLKNRTGDVKAGFIMAACTCIIPIVLMIVYRLLSKKESDDKQS